MPGELGAPPCQTELDSVDSETTVDVDSASRSVSEPEPEVEFMRARCDDVTESGDSGICNDVCGERTPEAMTREKSFAKRNHFTIASLLELPT